MSWSWLFLPSGLTLAYFAFVRFVLLPVLGRYDTEVMAQNSTISTAMIGTAIYACWMLMAAVASIITWTLFGLVCLIVHLTR